jgi:hypothetical protein
MAIELKKMLAACGAAVLVLSAVACGAQKTGTTEETPSAQTSQSTTAEPAPAQTGDQQGTAPAEGEAPAEAAPAQGEPAQN